MKTAIFGLDAAACAFEVPLELPVIASDSWSTADALAEGVRRRKRGESFFVRVIIADPRSVQANAIALQLYDEFPAQAQRRAAFAALAAGTVAVDGRLAHPLEFFNPQALEDLGDLLRMADRVIVTSWAQYRTLREVFLRVPEPLLWTAFRRDPIVPEVRTMHGAGSVVVWAPRLRHDQIAVVRAGLEEIGLPVTFVVHAFSETPGPFTYVRAKQAASALESADVIVDASLATPAAARTLAGCGAALVVASTCGAHEYLEGVHTYDPWDAQSIGAAVRRALGSSPPVIRAIAGASKAPDAQVYAPLARGPLVSVIVRSRTNGRFLARALASLSAQHYAGVEPIVWELQNESAPWQRARGDYLIFMDDSAVLFPDHVGTLVGVLERCGGRVAASGAVAARVQESEGDVMVRAYRVVPKCSLLFRRELAEQIGFRDALVHFDIGGELDRWLRLREPVVDVPCVSAMYTLAANAQPAFAPVLPRVVPAEPLEWP